RFVERQIATMQDQDVANLKAEPVVMLDFWTNTAKQLGLDAEIEAIEATVLEQANALRARAEIKETIADNALYTELRKIARTPEHAVPQPKDSSQPRIVLAEWHAPLLEMRQALMSLVETHLGE